VPDLRETAVRADADGARGRVVGGEFGMGQLQRLELAHQGVVLGIRDRGVVEDVVAVIGVFDARAQFPGAGGGGGVWHGGDCRARALAARRRDSAWPALPRPAPRSCPAGAATRRTATRPGDAARASGVRGPTRLDAR